MLCQVLRCQVVFGLCDVGSGFGWRYVQKCTQQQKWQKWQNFADNNLEANANEKTRGPPWKAGEFGEFGESGKNGKLVKIADNNLEANANEKTRAPPLL